MMFSRFLVKLIKKPVLFLSPVFLLQFTIASAQNVFTFKSGLIVNNVHQYVREALFTDHLAYQLNNGTLKKPTNGNTLFTDQKGQASIWKTLIADTGNRFKSRALVYGYLYLTYNSASVQTALLNITSNQMVYVNGEPRAGDLYGFGYLALPIQLKKGLNEFYVRGSSFSAGNGIVAKLNFQPQKVFLNIGDLTLPNAVIGQQNDKLRGAVVVVNATAKPFKNLKIKSALLGKELISNLPEIPAMTTRKVGFLFNAANISQKGKYDCFLSLMQGSQQLNQQNIKVEMMNADEDYNSTFISKIDGSTQYYSVSPQKQPGKTPPALYLSVHGAGVEAINQARAYGSKTEGVLITPTNRRPRGFNWEDWGRIDAMEVLNITKKIFNPDTNRIYLTGHSMGGHGTWFLGATYPGKWAAIAPCSGYPTLAAYGSADGKIPDSAGKSPLEHLLLQASNASNVLELAHNYTAAGVYIHHGDSDKVVSVEYARQMLRLLVTFHKDLGYHEQPGGEHWYGDISVDWPPIFDFFNRHTIPADSIVETINFTTANTAVSSKLHWASILQQMQTLKYSRINIMRDKKLKTISGITENVAVLGLSLNDFKAGQQVFIKLDGGNTINYTVKEASDLYLSKTNNQWQISVKPNILNKGIVRNGTFKEPFNHRMVFVYGTKGNVDENHWAYNKARFDAESWYYRGNGAVDIVADKDFKASAYPDRGVILYGNLTTNSAGKNLLKNCPVKVSRDNIKVGNASFNGDNLSAYFIWPRADSKTASVAVISGSGLKGMRAAEANQYLAAGSGFPDFMIFSADLPENGSKAVKVAGFYNNQWALNNSQTVVQ
ncbi:MAG: alpha/beta hydrolase-fold protein [Janthinobacterium lividum]